MDELTSVPAAGDRIALTELLRVKQLLAEFSEMVLFIPWNQAFENLHAFPREMPSGLCRFGDLIISYKKEIKTLEPLFRCFYATHSASIYLSDKKHYAKKRDHRARSRATSSTRTL